MINKRILKRVIAGVLTSVLVATSVPQDIFAANNTSDDNLTEISTQAEDEIDEAADEDINEDTKIVDEGDHLTDGAENPESDGNSTSTKKQEESADTDSEDKDSAEDVKSVSEEDAKSTSGAEEEVLEADAEEESIEEAEGEKTLSDIKFTDVNSKEVSIADFGENYNNIRFVIYSNVSNDYSEKLWRSVIAAMPVMQSTQYDFVWVDCNQFKNEEGEYTGSDGGLMLMKDHLSQNASETDGYPVDRTIQYVPSTVRDYNKTYSDEIDVKKYYTGVGVADFGKEYAENVQKWSKGIYDNSRFVELSGEDFENSLKDLHSVIKGRDGMLDDDGYTKSGFDAGQAFVVTIKGPTSEDGEAQVVETAFFDPDVYGEPGDLANSGTDTNGTNVKNLKPYSEYFTGIIRKSWEFLSPVYLDGDNNKQTDHDTTVSVNLKTVDAEYHYSNYVENDQSVTAGFGEGDFRVKYDNNIGYLFVSDKYSDGDGLEAFEYLTSSDEFYQKLGKFDASTGLPQKLYYMAVVFDDFGLPVSRTNVVCSEGNDYGSYHYIENRGYAEKRFSGVTLGTWKQNGSATEFAEIDPKEGITIHVGESVKLGLALVNKEEGGSRTVTPMEGVDWRVKPAADTEWYAENITDSKLKSDSHNYNRLKSDSLAFKVSLTSSTTLYNKTIVGVKKSSGEEQEFVAAKMVCEKNATRYNNYDPCSWIMDKIFGNSEDSSVDRSYIVRIPVTVLDAEEGVEYPTDEPYIIEKSTENANEVFENLIRKYIREKNSRLIYVDEDCELSLDYDFSDLSTAGVGMVPWESDHLIWESLCNSPEVLGFNQFGTDSTLNDKGEIRTYKVYKAMYGGIVTDEELEKDCNYDLDTILGRNGGSSREMVSKQGKRWDATTTNALRTAYSKLQTDGISDEEAIRAVYNWITKNVNGFVGKKNSRDERMDPENHMAYTALEKGYGTCQAFAVLFYRLAREMGVPSKVIMGTDANAHTYNIVRNGEDWYYIDTSAKIYLKDATQFKRTTEQDIYRDAAFVRNYLYKVKNYTATIKGNVKVYKNDQVGFVTDNLLYAQDYILEDIKSDIEANDIDWVEEEKSDFASGKIANYTIELGANISIIADTELDFTGYDVTDNRDIYYGRFVSLNLNGRTLTVRADAKAVISVGHVYNGTINIANYGELSIAGLDCKYQSGSHFDTEFRAKYEKVTIVGGKSWTLLNASGPVYFDDACKINVKNACMADGAFALCPITADVLEINTDGTRKPTATQFACENDIHLNGAVNVKYLAFLSDCNRDSHPVMAGYLYVRNLKVSDTMRLTHNSHVCVEDVANINNLGTFCYADTGMDLYAGPYWWKQFENNKDLVESNRTYTVGQVYLHPVISYDDAGQVQSRGVINLSGNIDGARLYNDNSTSPFVVSPVYYRYSKDFYNGETHSNEAYQLTRIIVDSYDNEYKVPNNFVSGDEIGTINTKAKARRMIKAGEDEFNKSAYEVVAYDNMSKYFDIKVDGESNGIAGILEDGEWYVGKSDAVTVSTVVDGDAVSKSYPSVKSAFRGLDSLASKQKGKYTFTFGADCGLRTNVSLPAYVTETVFDTKDVEVPVNPENPEGDTTTKTGQYALDLNGFSISTAGKITFDEGLRVVNTKGVSSINQTATKYDKANPMATAVVFNVKLDSPEAAGEEAPAPITVLDNIAINSKKGLVYIKYDDSKEYQLKTGKITAGSLEIDFYANEDSAISTPKPYPVYVSGDINVGTFEIGKNCSVVTRNTVTVPTALRLHQQSILIPQMQLKPLDIVLVDDRDDEIAEEAYIYKKSDVHIQFVGKVTAEPSENNMRLGIGLLADETENISGNLDTVLGNAIDYTEQTKLGAYTAKTFDAGRLFAKNKSPQEKATYTGVYATKNEVFAGRKSITVYRDVNGGEEYDSNKLGDFYYWAEASDAITKAIKDDKNYNSNILIKVKDNMYINGPMYTDFKANKLTIRGVNTDGSDITNGAKVWLGFIGQLALGTKSLVVENIDFEAYKYNTKLKKNVLDYCDIISNNGTTDLKNCSITQAGNIFAQNGAITLTDTEINKALRITVPKLSMNHSKINSVIGASTISDTLEMESSSLRGEMSLSIKNIISKDNGNTLGVQSNPQKNLNITGEVTAEGPTKDEEQVIYKYIADGKEKNYEFKVLDEADLQAMSGEEHGKYVETAKIKYNAIDIRISEMEDKVIPRSTIAVSKVASAEWFTYGCNFDKGKRIGVKAVTEKSGDKITLRSATGYPVALFRSDTSECSEENRVLVLKFYSVSDALTEISKINDKSLYYYIELNDDTISADGLAVSNSKQALKLPKEAARITIKSNVTDAYGDIVKARLGFNGALTANSNVVFENITFVPTGASMAIDGSKFDVKLVNCEMAEGKSITKINVPKTLTLEGTNLVANGTVYVGDLYLVGKDTVIGEDAYHEGVTLTARALIKVGNIYNYGSTIETVSSVSVSRSSGNITKATTGLNVTGYVINEPKNEDAPEKLKIKIYRAVRNGKITNYEPISKSECGELAVKGFPIMQGLYVESDAVVCENLDTVVESEYGMGWSGTYQKASPNVVYIRGEANAELEYAFTDSQGSVHNVKSQVADIAAAVKEINAQKKLREYKIWVLTDDAGSLSKGAPVNLTLPSAKVASKLTIVGKVPTEGERVGVLPTIKYKNDMPISCTTVFKNIIFDAVNAKATTPATISLAGNRLTLEGTVKFMDLVNVNGKNGYLTIAESAKLYTGTDINSDYDEPESKANILRGNISALKELVVKTGAVAPEAGESGESSGKLSEFTVTGGLAVENLTLKNNHIVVGRNATINTLEIDDDESNSSKSKLDVRGTFKINKYLRVKTSGATLATIAKLNNNSIMNTGLSINAFLDIAETNPTVSIQLGYVETESGKEVYKYVQFEDSKGSDGRCYLLNSSKDVSNLFVPSIENIIDTTSATAEAVSQAKTKWLVKYNAETAPDGYRMTWNNKLFVYFGAPQ